LVWLHTTPASAGVNRPLPAIPRKTGSLRAFYLMVRKF